MPHSCRQLCSTDTTAIRLIPSSQGMDREFDLRSPLGRRSYMVEAAWISDMAVCMLLPIVCIFLRK